MDEMKKTLSFAGVALVLAAWAGYSRLPASDPAIDTGEGRKFFPEFSDPDAAGALEVVVYDTGAERVSRFKVVRDNEFWKIPTHFNYPADARDRLAKTAGAVIDLEQTQFVTDRTQDYADLGVLNPEEEISSGEALGKDGQDGRGKLIRISKTDGGEPLAQYVIGKPVPDREGYRYVRRADKRQVYAAKADVDISTRFADWIETNLLKVDTSKVSRITFNHNRFDQNRGIVVENGRAAVQLDKALVTDELFSVVRGDNGTWSLEDGELGEGKEFDAGKVSSLLGALGDVKIQGVRTKPSGLIRYLNNPSDNQDYFRAITSLGEDFRKTLADIQPLTQGRSLSEAGEGPPPSEPTGFYLCDRLTTQDGRRALVPFGLLTSFASVRVGLNDGTVYNLYFGEPIFAEGSELEAGTPEPGSEAKTKGEGEGEDSESKTRAESRFLFVTVEFDESLVPPPTPEPDVTPSRVDVVFEDPFQTPELAAHPLAEQRKTAEEAAERRAEAARKAREERIETARKAVDQLAKRFAPWYYVTPGDAVKSIALRQADLARDKPAAAEGGSGSGAGAGVTPGAGLDLSDFGLGGSGDLDSLPEPNP